MYKYFNQMKNENIIIPRVVNQQVMDFNGLCEYLSDGSTLTAGDVAAVMKLLEMRLPLLLGLNTKVVCSPDGLTMRPKVTGSLTQSELRVKLQQQQLDNPDEDIDVNRDIETKDLSVSDLDVSIGIEIPKAWTSRFQTRASLKRITKKAETNATGSDDNTNSGGTSGEGNSGSTDNP